MRVDYYSNIEGSKEYTSTVIAPLDYSVICEHYYLDIVTSEEDKEVFGIEIPDLIRVMIIKSDNLVRFDFTEKYDPPTTLVRLVYDTCKYYILKQDKRSSSQVKAHQSQGKYGYRSISNIYIDSIESHMTAMELTIRNCDELDLIPRSSWVKCMSLIEIHESIMKLTQEHQSELYGFTQCTSLLVESPYESIHGLRLHSSSITWCGTKRFHNLSIEKSYFTPVNGIKCDTLSLVESTLSSNNLISCNRLHILKFIELNSKVLTKDAKLDHLTLTPELFHYLVVKQCLTLVQCDFTKLTKLPNYEEIFITDNRSLLNLSDISFEGSYVAIDRSSTIINGPSRVSINECSFTTLTIKDKEIGLYGTKVNDLTITQCNNLTIVRQDIENMEIDSITTYLSGVKSRSDNSNISIKSYKNLFIGDSRLKSIEVENEGSMTLMGTEITSLSLEMHKSTVTIGNCIIPSMMIKSSYGDNALEFRESTSIHRLHLDQVSFRLIVRTESLKVEELIMTNYVLVTLLGKVVVSNRIIIASNNPSNINWEFVRNLVSDSTESTKVLVNTSTYKSFRKKFDLLNRELIILSMNDIRKEF